MKYVHLQIDSESDNTDIRSEACPTCAVCGGEGQFIYLGQRDRIFGARGEWHLKRCLNDQCGLVWLDPMPRAEDIGKAYARYFTHASPVHAHGAGVLQRIYTATKREYMAGRYGYRSRPDRSSPAWIRHLVRLLPMVTAEVDGAVRFLRALPGGRLLDVGCGSGDWMLSMRDLGWDVTGVDFDENAVSVGRRKGLTVHCGSLEHQNFSSNTFNAVTLNHVIEHVPDPLGLLRECVRVLIPGGQLVLFTPNGESLGHRIFKESWRGLEPPRHLHIFSFPSMYRALQLAGFQRLSVIPWIGSSILYESYLLKHGLAGSIARPEPGWVARCLVRASGAVEQLLVRWKPSFADCLAALAIK